MNLSIRKLLIFSAVLASELFLSGQHLAAAEVSAEVPNISASELIPAQSANFTLIEALYPEPSYMPLLKPYIIDRNHDIWHAQDPSSYITKDNAWVKYYASLLYIDYDGRIKYINRPVPLVVDTNGNVLYWTDEPFVNDYVSDDEQFHFPPNGDMWVMPDYYLTHGMKDDCDGWMVTVTSLMLSGEMSIKENEQFVRTVVPAKVVLGYMGGFRDGWTEFRVYGKTFLTTTSLINTGIDGNEKKSSTEFIKKDDKITAKPVFEFTDKNFGEYKAWQ